MSTGEDSPGRNNPKTALWETDRLLHGHSVSVVLPGGRGRAAAPPQPLPGPGRAGGARLVCGRGCKHGFTSPPFPKR